MATTRDLQRWVEAGLIDADTASAIERHEDEHNAGRDVGRGIAAVAYLGAAMILIAVGLLAVEFWDQVGPWGRFTTAAGVTVVLVVAGWLLGRSEVPAVNQAQAFAWLLAAFGVALTATVAVGDLAELAEPDAFVVVAAVSLAATVGLWWLRRSVLQVAAMGLATGMTVISVVAWFDPAADWWFGVSLASVGLAWLLLTWAGVLEPTRTSYAVGGLGVLLVSVPEAADMPWPVVGLVAGLALMGVSVVLDEDVLLGLGVLGLFVYIPMVVFELFGDTAGVPVALLTTGLVLLGVVLAAGRMHGGPGTGNDGVLP